MGVLYVLDEPSIGLHPRDNDRLLATLRNLRDIGNTVLVVEHDEETIRTADWVIDLGPGAGEHGGRVIAEGPIEDDLAERRIIDWRLLLSPAAGAHARRTPQRQRQVAESYRRAGE
jgi:excinuclease ABC subunit A